MPEARSNNTAKAPSTPIDWRRVHLWQIQPVRDGLMVAGVLGLIYLGKVLSIVTVPMLLALLFAYLFEPLIRRITATRHVSRQGAALGIIVLAGVLILVPLVVGAIVGVVQTATVAANIARNTGDLIKAVDPQTPDADRVAANHRLDEGFWRWSSQSISHLRSEIEEYRQRRDSPKKPEPGGAAAPDASKPQAPAPQDQPAPQQAPEEPTAAPQENSSGGERPHEVHLVYLPPWKEELYGVIDSTLVWLRTNSDQIAQALGKQALGGGAQFLGSVLSILSSVGFLIFSGFLTAFFFYFFSTGWGRVLVFWEALIPERRKSRVIELVQKMDRVIAGFVRGRLTICLILGVYMTIAYWLIGVPSALLLGPIVGLLFIVPFAHVIGVPIAIILMSLEPSSTSWQNAWWWVVFAPVGVYMGAQMLDDYFLSPVIQGKNTNMDTPTILFASLAGGALAGVYGLLIAIPVAACIKILFIEVFLPRFREWAQGKKPDFIPIES